MSFEAKDYSIGNIFNKVVFDIPRNQRRYVWKKSNWEDLYEDIKFSILVNKAHFLGSIVLSNTSRKDGLSYYTITDGQQRLTTITLLLVAIMKHYHENDMSNEFLGTVSYLQSKDDSNQDIVMLNSEYHLSISTLVKGIIELTDKKMAINAFVDTHILSKEKDKGIGDAVKYFYGRIKTDLEKAEDPQKYLREIRSVLLDMTVVKIVSNTEEDSYTIFEILNARGQELAEHELLKNYIMRYIQPVERRDDAKSKWEEMERSLGSTLDKFIKHYATHRYGDTRDKYKSPYQAIQKATRGKDIGDLFNDIKLKSEYYHRIVHPSLQLCCSDTEYNIFNFFKSNRFEQFRPILLSLIHQKELGLLCLEKYERILGYIYNFFVCYTIIGEEKSNKLEDVVFKYARMFEDSFSQEVLEDFADNLKGKIPSYEWFLNVFKNIGWSNHYDLYKGDKNKKRIQIILDVIERFVSPSHECRAFTVEHILPDSENIANGQIGNLIPLEDSLNRRCENKEFDDKNPIYKESGFTSARNVANYYEGKEFVPEDRTVYLAKLVYDKILSLKRFDLSKV